MTVDAWGRATPAHMQKPEPEPVPCSLAHTIHCCEYHGIHSDDDFEAALDLLRRVNGARWFHGDPLHGDIVAFLAAHPPLDPSDACRQGTSTVAKP